MARKAPVDNNAALQTLLTKYENDGIDLNSRQFARVERHLQSEVHELNRLPRRIVSWVGGARSLERFVQTQQRHPRENSRRPREDIAEEERMLAGWVRFQRSQAARKRLCGYQIERLELVPGFSWNPIDDRWERQLGEYVVFFETQGRAPRYRAEDPAERRLAAWAAKQRHNARRNPVPPHRRAALKLLGGRSQGS